jgi:hypothetical protein
MRCAVTQMLLGGVDRLPPIERDAIRARVGGAELRITSEALPIAWGPMARHMRLTVAIRETVGSARNVELWTETMAALFERPILRSFVQMSTSLFGVTPRALLRQTDRFYAQLTRDIGELVCSGDPTERSGEVMLRGFPAERFDFPCYAEGMQGCLAAVLPLTRARGQVSLAAMDEARGEARLRMEWAPIGRG